MEQTNLHDPGPAAAGERGEAHATAAREPIRLNGSRIRIGTASWTDPTMTAPGVFYPPDATTAEERLVYYADQFPLVEVDATYYALPARRQGELWMERTPPEFTFDIKALAEDLGQHGQRLFAPIFLVAGQQHDMPAAAGPFLPAVSDARVGGPLRRQRQESEQQRDRHESHGSPINP